MLYPLSLTILPGELVAIHRKVHLFDIDIPGKIRFKASGIPPTLGNAAFLNERPGEREPECRRLSQLL